jgi:hypothetical protein
MTEPNEHRKHALRRTGIATRNKPASQRPPATNPGVFWLAFLCVALAPILFRLAPHRWRCRFLKRERGRPMGRPPGENPARYRTGFALHIYLFAVLTDGSPRGVVIPLVSISSSADQSERVYGFAQYFGQERISFPVFT